MTSRETCDADADADADADDGVDCNVDVDVDVDVDCVVVYFGLKNLVHLRQDCFSTNTCIFSLMRSRTSLFSRWF